MANIETILQTDNGKIINGDNLEVLSALEENSVDSCISDFPYDLSFMGRKWDNTGNFYEWNKTRADKLIKVIKPGGYAAIFGHPKTNHRMKCAFEDVGFRIVEEIDWVYLTGMPKNQDIGKLFTKADMIELAKNFNGWKTAGLKPAHEPITVFQKPLEGKYIQNIEKYGCGGMNIDACRVPISKEDIDMINAKSSKNPTTNYSDREDKVYGKYAEDKASPANELGRFPANMVIDEFVAELFDTQTGYMKSKRSNRGVGFSDSEIFGSGNKNFDTVRGFNDEGGGSRMLTVIKYQQKVSPSERKLPNGERNPHVTLKPIELIKWLIKLLTPTDGVTIDITAGSCTHAVACEELNKNDGYGLKYVDIELMNTEDEPYCSVGKTRVKAV